MAKAETGGASAKALLQSTVNIIFVNIDWDRGHHDTAKSESKNLNKLRPTIESESEP